MYPGHLTPILTVPVYGGTFVSAIRQGRESSPGCSLGFWNLVWLLLTQPNSRPRAAFLPSKRGFVALGGVRKWGLRIGTHQEGAQPLTCPGPADLCGKLGHPGLGASGALMSEPEAHCSLPAISHRALAVGQASSANSSCFILTAMRCSGSCVALIPQLRELRPREFGNVPMSHSKVSSRADS